MSEQTAHESGCFILPDSHTDQAIPRMAQVALIKAEVTCKEGRTAKAAQEWDDFVVFHPFLSHVVANLANRNMLTAQDLALTFEDVFVQIVSLLSVVPRLALEGSSDPVAKPLDLAIPWERVLERPRCLP